MTEFLVNQSLKMQLVISFFGALGHISQIEQNDLLHIERK